MSAKKSRASIDQIIEKYYSASSKKKINDIEDLPGFRRDFIDDEFNEQRYRKDVGPTSYDTLNHSSMSV